MSSIDDINLQEIDIIRIRKFERKYKIQLVDVETKIEIEYKDTFDNLKNAKDRLTNLLQFFENEYKIVFIEGGYNFCRRVKTYCCYVNVTRIHSINLQMWSSGNNIFLKRKSDDNGFIYSFEYECKTLSDPYDKLSYLLTILKNHGIINLKIKIRQYDH